MKSMFLVLTFTMFGCSGGAFDATSSEGVDAAPSVSEASAPPSVPEASAATVLEASAAIVLEASAMPLEASAWDGGGQQGDHDVPDGVVMAGKSPFCDIQPDESMPVASCYAWAIRYVSTALGGCCMHQSSHCGALLQNGFCLE